MSEDWWSGNWMKCYSAQSVGPISIFKVSLSKIWRGGEGFLMVKSAMQIDWPRFCQAQFAYALDWLAILWIRRHGKMYLAACLLHLCRRHHNLHFNAAQKVKMQKNFRSCISEVIKKTTTIDDTNYMITSFPVCCSVSITPSPRTNRALDATAALPAKSEILLNNFFF